ncbi:MAG: hypothetical protein M3292_11430, partial [Actinomycetota bacterium]|nr:hypothetical protein [Actinomycetota bacterium]
MAAAVTEGAAGPPDSALVEGLRAAFLAALGFVVLGVLSATVLIRERECSRELVRREADEEPGLETAAAGCVAALGGRVIDGADPLPHEDRSSPATRSRAVGQCSSVFARRRAELARDAPREVDAELAHRLDDRRIRALGRLPGVGAGLVASD